MAVRTVLVAVVAVSIGLGASFVVARRARSTGSQQASTRLLSQLSTKQRRTVGIAVRQGRQVDDPHLRPAAAAMARAMLDRVARLDRPSRWRRVLWVAFALTSLIAAAGVVFADDRWPHVFTLAVNAVLAVLWWLAVRVLRNVSVRAEAALVANEG